MSNTINNVFWKKSSQFSVDYDVVCDVTKKNKKWWGEQLVSSLLSNTINNVSEKNSPVS